MSPVGDLLETPLQHLLSPAKYAIENVATALGWPQWALEVIAGQPATERLCRPHHSVGLGAAVVVAFLLQLASSGSWSSAGSRSHPKATSEFRWFQAQYLSVYLTVMLADWLQGTNMYTLYSSYGVNVGTLFITGFLSSAVFGTFLGVLTDKWGRRNGCIIFCVLEVRQPDRSCPTTHPCRSLSIPSSTCRTCTPS